MANELVHWVLSDGSRELTCVMRRLEGGADLGVLYYDGLPLKTHVCSSEAEAMQWASDVRELWLAHGFVAEREATRLTSPALRSAPPDM
jgi:hypothetical protein